MFRQAVLPLSLAASLLALAACGSSDNSSSPPATPAVTPQASLQDALPTATPIKHLVVIFGENVSFDHYFGHYPVAANPSGEPMFNAAANTPAVNGLTPALINNNPNATNPLNAALTPPANVGPFRLDRAQANTSDQNHGYTAEQQAYDNGLADAFPKFTGKGTTNGAGAFGTAGQVMGYFDGNTVTAMWNYAQHFALNDNAYTDTYGPSTPGAIEVISGQTDGVVLPAAEASLIPPTGPLPTVALGTLARDTEGGLTLIGDGDPTGDVCSSSTTVGFSATNKNIGTLLSAANITWGGFMGGFNLLTVNPNGSTGCNRSHFSSVLNSSPGDYTQHHNWFQYYPSTANPTHARPSSIQAIGFSTEADGQTPDPANHEYDTDDFFAAVEQGNFPSVSYLKAPAFEDAHPGNSDPLDEQAFVTQVINFLQQQPDWNSTAVIVTYDDSDGWYDHRFATPTSSSFDSLDDQLNGTGTCTASGVPQPGGVNGGPVNGRCGPGTRIPFLVISPWAKTNFVDDTPISQASVVRFIEDNWLQSQRIGQGSFDATAGSIMSMFDFSGSTGKAPTLFLDSDTGTPLAAPPANSANITPD
ncbi:phospholipase C [Paraburkholderia solisilvae]|uniref:Non-hemolytic phospholipase C n=1 Tax=Paraburkholderia solisilvae TaxID=624376 RepID=A0A6J5E999_9BURK|nr:alkaline phosphatase family protein [Paraburkholderia solisilvae]CAB3761635.1 Non-hemolytic phospholipase C [Paraburkholderia solisilvae]